MKKIETDKHVDEVTLGEVKSLIDNAFNSGWESDDGFLLAVGLRYGDNKCVKCGSKDHVYFRNSMELICNKCINL